MISFKNFWIIFVLLLFPSCYNGFRLIKTFFADRVKHLLQKRDSLPTTFEQPRDRNGKLKDLIKKPKNKIPVLTIDELRSRLSEGYRLHDLDVRGNINEVLFENPEIHPVVELLYKRKKEKSEPGNRVDGNKVAVAIEGGGMRGCVGAGMISAIWYLGLTDSVDVVYGSSAGSLVGAYFIADQLPYFGPEIYYDILSTAGKDFIDIQSVLRSCGLGIFDLRLKSLVNLFQDRMGKPVLNLNYLFDNIVMNIRPINWDVFWEKQTSNKLTLKVVASGLLSKGPVVLSAENRNFCNVEELSECMKASMLVPGVTGEVIRLKGDQAAGDNIAKTWWKEYSSRTKSSFILGSEPLTDALLFEPIPYRSALKENCTHVVVLRTKPDNSSVVGKLSVLEKMINIRFFGRKLGLPDMAKWVVNQNHKVIYAEDVLKLNEENRDFRSDEELKKNGKVGRLFGIAMPAGSNQVKRLETKRDKIFESVRQGFAAAYDGLVEDPKLRGNGMKVAKEIWTDEILAQIPAHLLETMQKEDFKENEYLDDEEMYFTARESEPSRMFQDAEVNKMMEQEELSNLAENEKKTLVNALTRLQTVALPKLKNIGKKENKPSNEDK